MPVVRIPVIRLLAFGVILSAAGIGVAQADGVQAIAGLRPGSYEARDLDTGAQRRLCIRTQADLIQLRHSGVSCTHYIVEDKPNALGVRYSCPGGDWGMTRIRSEGRDLGQIESQGIAQGAPFSLRLEMRYREPC